MPQQFILGDTLSDAQVDELVQHGSVEIDGFLFQEWRTDQENQTWLKRISGDIHGVEPTDGDIYADGFVDAPDDDDDSDVECTWFFDGYSDDE